MAGPLSLAAQGAVEVRGLAELEKRLKALPGRVAKKVLRGAVMAGAQVIAKEAATRAPVGLTGTLFRSIRRTSVRGGSSSIEVRVGPSRRAYYGMFFEFGTEKMAARPFLRPAFDAKKEEALKRIGERLGAGIEREAAKLG